MHRTKSLYLSTFHLVCATFILTDHCFITIPADPFANYDIAVCVAAYH